VHRPAKSTPFILQHLAAIEIRCTLQQITRSGMMYEATRILGEGAFGQVYEATSAGSKTVSPHHRRCSMLQGRLLHATLPYTAPSQPVAIKIIRSSGLIHSQVAREEIRIHRTISHDAVVRFVEAWSEPGRIFIVLELCSATLADYIGFLHSPRS
jgi:serine/threonine protein kinase